MKDQTLSATGARALPATEQANAPDHLLRYYANAGLDYRSWSPDFNMHFGYYRRGLNPLRREAMLEEMNRQVVDGLVAAETPTRLIDLGCGLGATAAAAVRRHPRLSVDAVSLVPWQIEQARHRARRRMTSGELDRLAFHCCDYRATPFPSRSVDGAWALESACHANGPDKADFLREAARLIKPGGRLVVADGFLKTPTRPRWYQRLVDTVGHCWAVEEFAVLPAFVQALRNAGFEDVRVRDLSGRIAPSVLHVPAVIVRHLAATRRTRRDRNPESRDHLLACALSPLVGLFRPWFGYYMITATRSADDATA